jgi:hypothetical protein
MTEESPKTSAATEQGEPREERALSGQGPCRIVAGGSTYHGEYDQAGADLSLLRYTLGLSPIERLLLMERCARDKLALRDYGRRYREAKDASDR